ncbi:cbb3-type cytochrome c oxidase subunit I [Candidatus Methylacidithermus pantelleriae]|uniref:Cytochrome c oxidase, subunit 1 n=1 Tax=Candidatus Methylacidithermus pantelleriae TaxID=2744239 RepID=A0A8J2BL15_9BACT|nr:cbb3-type cytochrome c oxidase subunit I [Candidatus Methylacidithermus pantelleriae]CAF0691892.1 Cytochrome c oxidase, subunit 1 [Candidatus Methylacidithermus pantelleriae]
MTTGSRYSEAVFDLSESHKRVCQYTLVTGLIALSLGIVNGLAQAINYAGIDLFQYFPGMRTYYQGLTAHGIFNAFVLTFAFSNCFVSLVVEAALGVAIPLSLLWSAFGALFLGATLAAFSIFQGSSNVLYTFYPPFQASPLFYAGLALLVISTWITSIGLFVTLATWRKNNPTQRIPLPAFLGVVTYIFWDISSAGVAIEVVAFLLPWSLGLLPGIDPGLSRSLFWYTGHPIVYFWLLPVYLSWYTMVPKLAGGQLLSDRMARIAFLFFLLTIPVGFHHQYVDPHVPVELKLVTTFLTFAVMIPSFMTAFSVLYALEIAGRARGGKGLLGWFFKLPWDEPALVPQLLGMIAFLGGGITGLMNASYTMNLKIHNTTFVPGHFHLTLGTAVALSYGGIGCWLVPYLCRRTLINRQLPLVGAWIYFIGVLLFARGEISGGLAGMPRRTALSIAHYPPLPGWKLAGTLTALGGSLMFIGMALILATLLLTFFLGKAQKQEERRIPFCSVLLGPSSTGWEIWLDRLWFWTLAALVLTGIVYGDYFLFHAWPPHLEIGPFKSF